MDGKEQINSLITVGADLPTANPYLDDTDQGDITTLVTKEKTKGKRKIAETAPKVLPQKKDAHEAPDPKEYIAELERSENEEL